MKSKKIYIIDDDKIALLITKNIFSQVSHELNISCFSSSIEILNKFKEKEIEQPDILIVDINMPIITGFELIDALVELPHFNTNMKIYIQSSSIRQSELEFVSQSKHIHKHFEKYMTANDIKNILQQ